MKLFTIQIDDDTMVPAVIFSEHDPDDLDVDDLDESAAS